ncbi:MAG: phosphoenolpyruvate--protein phosphotransferase, partial [Planctomycetes bacterium]|nr:phosphoenolpyruvate--protein phosphotransferase [Planctomycetota bacterium]
MEIRQGISVSPGIVVREAFVLDSEDFRIPERLVRPDEVESEIARFERARLQANDEIQALQPDRGGAGREIALLFKFHQLVLEDAKILDEIVSLVRGDLYSAEYATSRVFRKLAKQIRSIPDPYLRERDVDIHDIEKRILRQLLGAKREGLANLTREVVVVAKDLTPSQLAGLDKSKVVGFATEAGGKTSHTAIVARTMGIPGVVGLEDITADVSGGDTVVIDGTAGRIIINPDPATLERYSKKEAEFKSYVMELGSATRSLPAETLDGHEVTLLVNIELPSDIEVALANGADGVGLYRTEFIYLQYVAPTEEDHLRVYSEASRRLEGRPLVIRTLDFGADKFFDENELSTEKNPFLGCRSIRLCFEKMDVFKTQLRAILRASHGANVKIMFPMISSRTELLKAKGILDEMKEELDAEGVPYDRNMEVGIMIEVPSAALTADLLAKEVDFFSIGTNDLIQYCLAVDRVNEKVANLYQPANPAIVRLIRRVLEAGEREGVKVSMCGEMSGDENFTLLLLGLGLREFSVNPAGLPRVKQIVRGASMVEA